jgi:hypothetical protein
MITSPIAATVSGADPGDSWDGYTIVPMDIKDGNGIKIVATSNRDILLKVAGIKVPFDSLTVTTTEKIDPAHGASTPRALALVGSDIDSTYSVEFGTYLTSGEADALREALFAGPNGEAVYHSISVTFMGDPAKGGAGRQPLITLTKCKARADTWTFSQGAVNKGRFEGLAIEYRWLGRI